jgi:hypothetical protein
MWPTGIDLAPDGTVFVADSLRIQAFGTAYPATWRGEYHSNRWLTGVPVLIRADSTLDFNWGAGSPGVSIPSDDFSARWCRHIWFNTGIYHFRLSADEGVRLWVDSRLLIERWKAGAATDTADVFLDRGYYPVQLEYFEGTGDAWLQLGWEGPHRLCLPVVVKGC